MMSVVRTLSCMLALACVLLPSSAEAGSIYAYAFDQTAYQVDAGATVEVKVFLQEQVSSGSVSVLATEGLIGAGVRVSFDLSPLPGDPAKILSASDVILNDGSGGFGGSFQSITLSAGSHADITETVDLFSPAVLATSVGGNLYQILLGTFRFTAGAIDGQTTLIQAGDIPGASDTVTDSGLAIDGQIVSSAISRIQVNSASVPEPSSVVALAIGMLGLGCHGIVLRFKSCNPR
jgi:hypothetical protein